MPHTLLRPRSRVRQADEATANPTHSQTQESKDISKDDEGPTPIRPKPANAPSNAGATSQLHSRRKPPRGPLVFVNSSDPNAEEEKKGNRKKIKKWAMLNKDSSHLRTNTSGGKPQLLSWNYQSPSVTANSKDYHESEYVRPPVPRRVQRQAPTIDKVGEALYQPFSSLPLKADDHAKRLLQYFLEGWSGRVEDTGHRVRVSNSMAFPVIKGSRAAFCSLIATLESNPWQPLRSGRASYRDSYLGIALSETYAVMKQNDRPLPESACLSVGLLIWVAHWMGEPQAVEVHFTGAAALASRHWNVFSRMPYFRGGPFFWTFRFSEIDIIPKHIMPENLRSIPVTHEFSLFSHDDISDFGALLKAGMIPSRLIDILPYLFSMNDFLVKAKCNNLSVPAAKELLLHIWINAKSLSLLEDECQTPVQHCIRYTMIIHFYSRIFQDPKLGVGWLSGPLRAHLKNADMKMLMGGHPQILLWMLLTAGPFAVDSDRTWYLDLLRQVQAIVGIENFHGNLQQYKEGLYWTKELDAAATRFWEEGKPRTPY